MGNGDGRKRVLSGIQPTGNSHIGNYLGAIRHWVASQGESETLFPIVDLHAITVPHDPTKLKAHIQEVAGILFAAGIDPEQSTVFVQSHVSAHAELAWILNCLIPMGWMERMTQFKEKAESLKERVSVGLFDYPALMAADILLYEVDLVPVGDDQRQHLELTRDVAQRFNSMFGETLKVPEASIPPVGARIMGLDDPTSKMSKSVTTPGHAIGLLDSPDDVRAKFKRAATDSKREIVFDENRPGVNNLLAIYEAFTGEKRHEIESHFEGKGYADLKNELSDAVIEGLRPLQERYRRIEKEPGHLSSMLKEGADKVRPMADRMLRLVMEKVGLG